MTIGIAVSAFWTGKKRDCIPHANIGASGYKTFPFIRNYLLQNLQIERIFKKSDAEVHKFCIHWPFFSRSGYKSRFRFFDKPVWK